MKPDFYNKYNYASILKFVSIKLDLIFEKSKPLQKIVILFFDITSRIIYLFCFNLFIVISQLPLFQKMCSEFRYFFTSLKAGTGFFASFSCLNIYVKICLIVFIVLGISAFINTFLAATHTVSSAMKKNMGRLY